MGTKWQRRELRSEKGKGGIGRIEVRGGRSGVKEIRARAWRKEADILLFIS